MYLMMRSATRLLHNSSCFQASSRKTFKLVLKTPFVLKPRFCFCVQSSSLCYVLGEGVDDEQRLAETICKLVCENGSSGNLESVLDSTLADNSFPPALVLQVLQKLNNAGTLALLFFDWAKTREAFQPSVESYNVLIESLGKIKQFKMVWVLVDEMKSKGILTKSTFALVWRRLARARRVKEALDAFEKMKKYGLNPELKDYNRLLDTLCKSRQVKVAQELFDKLSNKEFMPDIKSYTIMLEGWGQACDLHRLNATYIEMRKHGLEPDVVTYGILINAYCKAKRCDKSVNLYYEMQGKNMKATPHIYCTLISAFGIERRLDEAIKFFKLCKLSDYAIEAPTYNALVSAYCRSNRIGDVFRLMAEMRKCGLGPETRTYDIILHHLVKQQKTSEAFSLFLKMGDEPGCQPTTSTYEVMVRMFCNVGRMDMALWVWDQMKDRGVLPRMHTFYVLVEGLCEDGKVEEACRFFVEMMEMGIRPPKRLVDTLKEFLLEDGREEIVLLLAHKIDNLVAGFQGRVIRTPKSAASCRDFLEVIANLNKHNHSTPSCLLIASIGRQNFAKGLIKNSNEVYTCFESDEKFMDSSLTAYQ